MIDIDLYNIFLSDTTWQVSIEIILRCIVMYLIIITFLRLTGKRGVRQLSIFEIAILLCLGSAAGDTMFIQDLPIIHGVIVFLVIFMLYRLTTWAMIKSQIIEDLLEGRPLCVVKDGLLIHENFRKKLYSQDEFFSEMRIEHIEHLGQVRIALLESDGTLSLLYYEDNEVKWGLPIFPDDYVKIKSVVDNTFYSCMVCGHTKMINHIDQRCARCNHNSWAKSLNNVRKG